MATAKKKAAERPYTVDEMAQIGNILNAAKMPADVAKALSTPRLHIDGLDEAPRVGKAESGERTWELALQPGAQLGRSGRTGERLSRAEKVAGPGHTEPMRPDWSEQTFQPFAASESFRHQPMYRHNGVQLEPYYGVFGSDDRAVYYPSSLPVAMHRADLHVDQLGRRRRVGLVGLWCPRRSPSRPYRRSRLPVGLGELGHEVRPVVLER